MYGRWRHFPAVSADFRSIPEKRCILGNCLGNYLGII